MGGSPKASAPGFRLLVAGAGRAVACPVQPEQGAVLRRCSNPVTLPAANGPQRVTCRKQTNKQTLNNSQNIFFGPCSLLTLFNKEGKK